MSRIRDNSPACSTSGSDSESSIDLRGDSSSEAEVEHVETKLKIGNNQHQQAHSLPNPSINQSQPASHSINEPSTMTNRNMLRSSSIDRAVAFLGGGFPSVRLLSAAQQEMFDNLCEQVTKRQAEQRERKAADRRAQQKREADEAAERQAEVKRIRIKMFKSVMFKVSEWLQKLLILLGMLLVIYFMVEAMLPGACDKHYAELKHHFTQMWSKINDSRDLAAIPSRSRLLK